MLCFSSHTNIAMVCTSLCQVLTSQDPDQTTYPVSKSTCSPTFAKTAETKMCRTCELPRTYPIIKRPSDVLNGCHCTFTQWHTGAMESIATQLLSSEGDCISIRDFIDMAILRNMDQQYLIDVYFYHHVLDTIQAVNIISNFMESEDEDKRLVVRTNNIAFETILSRAKKLIKKNKIALAVKLVDSPLLSKGIHDVYCLKCILDPAQIVDIFALAINYVARSRRNAGCLLQRLINSCVYETLKFDSVELHQTLSSAIFKSIIVYKQYTNIGLLNNLNLNIKIEDACDLTRLVLKDFEQLELAEFNALIAALRIAIGSQLDTYTP